MKCNNCGGEWNPPKNISLTVCPFCNTPVIDNNIEFKPLPPHEVIKNIIEKYGADIFLNNKRLSALLMDLITEKTKERNILGIAINAGIPGKILSADNSDNKYKELISSQCKHLLCEDYGMSEVWAIFAVYCFTYALGWKDTNPQTLINKTLKEQINSYNMEKSNTNTTKSTSVKSLRDIVFSNDEPSSNDNNNSIVSKVVKKYKDLKSLVIQNNIPQANLNILGNRINLTSNPIPNSITSIGYRAFANSKDLISIIIPNSVKSIEYEAFKNCRNLKAITIPSSVVSIADGAFNGCINLTNIIVDKKNTKYSSDNGMLFNYDKTKLIAYPSAIIANIPNGVTCISNNAFGNCENLKSIIIPKSVTSIEYNAFWGCINLTNIIIDKNNIPYSSRTGMIFDYYKTRLISYPSAVIVDIPNTVNHIGYGAFGQCKNLTNIIIPNNVISIGNYAFESCTNLRSITISDRVSFISDTAFEGCIQLTDIIVDRRNMRYSSKDGMLFNSDKTSLISYPSASIVDIPDSVNHICDSAFLGCKNLNEIVIPKNVTSIGYMAFGGCKNLKSVTIPNTINHIGNYAFVECEDLIVYCSPNSYAEKYCKENNIRTNNRNELGIVHY